MSGAATIGAAVIGAGVSMSASKKASKSASAAQASSDSAAQLQYEVSMEQLDFQKQQYENWESIFGPIQQNLSNYYKNLSSDTIASSGIQNIEQQYVASRQNLDTQLAKRGITNSGATAAGLTQLETARMLGKADIQTKAPMLAAQQQTGFLAGGLNQQSGLQSGISGAMTNQMNMFGEQSMNKQNMANQYSNQAAQAYAGIGSSIGTGISSYLNHQTNQNYINSMNTMNQPKVVNQNTGGFGIYGLDYK